MHDIHQNYLKSDRGVRERRELTKNVLWTLRVEVAKVSFEKVPWVSESYGRIRIECSWKRLHSTGSIVDAQLNIIPTHDQWAIADRWSVGSGPTRKWNKQSAYRLSKLVYVNNKSFELGIFVPSSSVRPSIHPRWMIQEEDARWIKETDTVEGIYLVHHECTTTTYSLYLVKVSNLILYWLLTFSLIFPLALVQTFFLCQSKQSTFSDHI